MEGFFSTMTNNINSHAAHNLAHNLAGSHHPAATNGTNNHQRSVQNQATASASSSEKQFKCDFCDKTFTQRRNQRAHIRTVHEKLKPFQCTHCGLTANRKFNLLSHIKKMHGTTEGTAVVDTRLSGASATSVASSPVGSKTTNNSLNSQYLGRNFATQASASNHHSLGSKSKKSNPTHTHSVTENITHQQCLVCSAPVKLQVNKYFCDKCEPRFTAPATGSGNYLSNVQGRNFNSPASGAHRPPTQNPQTFRCLQCPFVTEDSSAMIGHHLHAHSSYPMPM